MIFNSEVTQVKKLEQKVYLSSDSAERSWWQLDKLVRPGLFPGTYWKFFSSRAWGLEKKWCLSWLFAWFCVNPGQILAMPPIGEHSISARYGRKIRPIPRALKWNCIWWTVIEWEIGGGGSIPLKILLKWEVHFHFHWKASLSFYLSNTLLHSWLSLAWSFLESAI